jgi:dihydrofolate reductase
MKAIVSVTKDWGIGLKGKLLVRNPVDMRFFKDNTMCGTVVCGQTTFLSFPGGALERRRNVVLSIDPTFAAKGAEVVHSLDEALAAVKDDDPERVWVIGGESVYRQLLPHCSHVLVTKNDVVLDADAFFPNLDEDPDWSVESTTVGGVTKAGIPFEFVTYVNKGA